MPAEPGLTELITTSLRNRSGKIQENVPSNHPVLFYMEKNGNIKKGETGRSLVEEHDFAENPSVMRFEGSEAVDTSTTPVISAFEFNWKEMIGNVQISEREKIQNGGMHGVIKLLGARLNNLESTLYNIANGDLVSDGTADGGKQLGGFDLLFPDDPTTGTVGGVSRVSNSYARSYTYDAVNTGGAATSSTNVERYMRKVKINTFRMGDSKSLIWFMGNTHYEALSEACSSRQRFVDKDLADLGFDNMKVDGVTCVLGGGYSFPGSTAQSFSATDSWLINTKFVKLRIGKGAYFQPLAKRDSTNQAVEIQYLYLAWALTCGHFGLNGKLFG